MAIQIDRRDRVFQLWAYTVGMGRLLLRSVKEEQFQTRVDVLFQDVQAIQLPATIPGLMVIDADDDERERIIMETGLLPDNGRQFFSIIGSGFTGHVVDGVVVSNEDGGEYFEPSKLWPTL